MPLQQIAHINEILDRIFVHLDKSTLATKIQLVCKQWYTVADEHIDYTYDANWLICWASWHGNLALVNKLLSHPKVDPCSCDNRAIIFASQYG
jgi:hypothetical protein